MTPLSLSLERQLKTLISHTHFHSGFRVFIGICISLLPVVFWQQVGIALTLCLGVVACAIAETDDSVKGRVKNLTTTLACFMLASFSVELLFDNTLLFSLGLGSSTFAFIMLGIFGHRYAQIAFGSLVIAIYTMIGHGESNPVYWQPLLLAAGALGYGVLSLLWLYLSPYKSLHEQLAQVYFSLSRYQLEKSHFFSHEKIDPFNTRQNLAVQNIAVVQALNLCKDTLNSRLNSNSEQQKLARLLQLYLIAQQIHERISATHYLYSQLDKAFADTELMEGFHQLFYQLSDATHQLGYAILSGRKFTPNSSLSWTLNALGDQLKYQDQQHHFALETFTPLNFVYKNLKGVQQLLEEAQGLSNDNTLDVLPALAKQPKRSLLAQLKDNLSISSTTFRHALRMSICFVTGYLLLQIFQLEKGFWVLLTCLFVCQPSFSATKKRLVERTLGTLAGILLGYPLLSLIDTDTGQLLLLPVTGFLFFAYLKSRYAVAVTFITLFVMLVFNLLSGSGLEIIMPRLQETLLGCTLAALTISFIFPDWQYLKIPGLIEHSLRANLAYFKQVVSQYTVGKDESLSYRIARKNAHIADTNLASAWQNMLIEPSSKRKLLNESYALTNRNNALLSYISALASHRHKLDKLNTDLTLLTLINQTEARLELAASTIANNHNEICPNDLQFSALLPRLENESLVIAQQLQLIANTAFDIQDLAMGLKPVNSNTK